MDVKFLYDLGIDIFEEIGNDKVIVYPWRIKSPYKERGIDD